MRSLFLGLATAAAVAFGSTAAGAVQFTGTTQGCFGPSCTPVSGPVSDAGLTYVSGSFDHNSDVTGFLGIGGLSDNLGTFNLDATPHTYTGDIFDLMVNFTNPGTGSNLYEATLQGIVTSATDGSVHIDFNNTPQLITATNGAMFTLEVNDVSITPGVLQILSGQLQAVPEPSTWAMMLLGFGAIGMATRRRRHTALAQVA